MKLEAFLYNTLNRTVASAIGLAAPFHTKARKLYEGHKSLINSIEKHFQSEKAPVAWFHCASLGEFEQGRPVMEAFKKEYPDYKILLTFFSPSGYEVRKDYAGADFICYLPFDTPGQAKRFIQAAKPRIAFFVKYEYWYNYLRLLHEQNVPTFLVSGIFNPSFIFFKPYGGFYRKMLLYFTHLFVQNKESARLLDSIGIRNYSLGGDTRFDRVAAICQQPKKIPLAEAFKADQPLLVAGSSWEPDLRVLAPLLLHYKGKLKAIIAPHEADEAHVEEAEEILSGLHICRFSKATEETAAKADVLLIDNVGMLSSLYALGDYAFVGGGFGKGLHNILEAATFGMPVFFGNKAYHIFQEAFDLIDRGGAFAIGSAGELQHRFSVLYEDEEKRKEAAHSCADYVQENTGATRQIMEYIQFMKKENARQNL
ncbi:3-deoxy-D-manno-octulosonic acid transferase [Nafulsella turpanensis]|uniref:3-deoxy-D-manno-octulosonic acid transferase n=1 Tax=Nafulsella turpanensis TaxID=1265690 RepID=UPI00034AAECF|nr:glycosyltransferase N-terminal domain-containing protein [Nafulsella turpanensis]